MERVEMTAGQKPRLRVVPMGVYWGSELQWEYTRFELRPGPDSPFTLDRTFIARSAERAYQMWREQVEEWRGILGAQPESVG